ncbi:MAG: type IV pilin protein [Gammaproteobacteria bacterium]|nr:type IV pilin protein [Gammaproteobacteria bacterium]
MQKQQGFTLIEMLIVIVVIAILASIALPAYRSQVISANRADAQGALMNLAQAMERYYTQNGNYDGTHANGVPTIFPAEVPIDGTNKSYTLKVITSGTPATAYTLTAIPISGSIQAGDGAFSLSSTGERLWNKGDNENGEEDTW